MIQSLRKLWKNHGGLHLNYHKNAAEQPSIKTIKVQAGQVLTLPLQQHAGRKAKPIVQVGDYVYKGQKIAQTGGRISATIHASTSGTIQAIEPRQIPHPSQLTDDCIVLIADGKDDWGEREAPAYADYHAYDRHELSRCIEEAGVVGLGGAVFPAAIKLDIRDDVQIETLILNGAECEPYITCDDLLMQEQAADIVAGIQIMQYMVKPQQCLIGIEDNKPQAIKAMQQAVAAINDPSIEVVSIPTLYPSGGAKQLTHILTGKEVPSGGRSTDIGVICHNVGTAHAIYQAVSHGKPLIERYVTVTGSAIKQPQNFLVPFGMSMQEVIQAAGGYQEGIEIRLDMGGPMMPLNLPHDELPVVKATNCILAREKETTQIEHPCIRCGSCATACPTNLLPQQLFWHAHAKEFEATEKLNLFDCIECGCCEYVCPSHIPLVDYYRFAKSEIYAQREAKQKAEVAKQRHDFRQERLEREKQEKAARLAKHKQKVSQGKSDDSNADAEAKKKAAIKAAMERAKARKGNLEQRNTEDLDPTQQQQINEADAKKAAIKAAMERAKAKKEAQAAKTAQSGAEDEKERKRAAVKAAMERAKAKKEAKATEETPEQAKARKRAAVKAAMERAKAKKEAQAAEAASAETIEETPEQAKARKRAAVKAAMERAKAKKEAQTAEAASAETIEETPEQAKARKREAVKAAMERAKAKKAAQKKESDAS